PSVAAILAPVLPPFAPILAPLAPPLARILAPVPSPIPPILTPLAAVFAPVVAIASRRPASFPVAAVAIAPAITRSVAVVDVIARAGIVVAVVPAVVGSVRVAIADRQPAVAVPVAVGGAARQPEGSQGDDRRAQDHALHGISPMRFLRVATRVYRLSVVPRLNLSGGKCATPRCRSHRPSATARHSDRTIRRRRACGK